MLAPFPVTIHPKAEVHDTARVGAGTAIWQYSSVIRQAVIGERCNIGANCIIDSARLGNHCKVVYGCSINPGIWIGDEVFIGPNVTICNDPWPRVRLGDFDIAKLLSGAFVTVRICDQASIGAAATILPGICIGKSAMVAAGAVVDRDVPAGYLFKRSGEIVEIERRQVGRMRKAALG